MENAAGAFLLSNLPSGSGVVSVRIHGSNTLWQEPVTLAEGNMTTLQIDLGAVARTTAPDCDECIAVFIRDSEFADLRSSIEEGVRSSDPFGDLYTRGVLTVPGGATVELEAGTYRVAVFDHPFFNSSKLSPHDVQEALDNAERMTLHPGENPALTPP